ncbi:MAG: iron uptake porin [Synechococcaceae cyanobacterium]|nr:iron uptake porin [Synechococcaceae cyanobacterium]
MKLFQRLLLAPVALGLATPVAVSAGEIASANGMAAVSEYMNQQDLDRFKAWEAQNQVTSINQFSDVKPTDWAYQALDNLIQRYGCVAGYPDGTYKGRQAMTRFEAAALLNACLDRITEITDEIQRLLNEFKTELAVLRGRVDKLEAKVGQLEATQFSTTTKLKGETTFVLGAVTASGNARTGGDAYPYSPNGVKAKLYNPLTGTTSGSSVIIYPNGNSQKGSYSFGYNGSKQPFWSDRLGYDYNDAKAETKQYIWKNPKTGLFYKTDDLYSKFSNRRYSSDYYNARYGAATFSADMRLNFETSFTGKDLLFTRLRAGNFDNAFNGNGLNLTALDKGFDSDKQPGNVVVDRLYYRFPVGKEWAFLVGARARNTEFLGTNPSVYASAKGDKILDFFAVHGVPGVYNKATGSMGGIMWKQNVKNKSAGRFSVSASYVSPVGNLGNAYDGNADECNVSEGGIGTDCSRASFLAQLGYATPQWAITAAYRYGQAGSNFRRGTNFVANNSWWLRNGESNSFALNGYWQPRQSGWIPSVSTGWAINSLGGNARTTDYYDAQLYVSQSQSWFVGLQWDDVFLKGNSAGMAVGQATFATALNRGTDYLYLDPYKPSNGFGESGSRTRNKLSTTPYDGNYVWEWWYKFQVTDNIAITPSLFYLSRPLGQDTISYTEEGRRRYGDTFGVFGGLIQTTFKF